MLTGEESCAATNASGTDSVAYCHMVWKKNDSPKFAKIRVI